MYAANNKGADQTARMRRLICAFVVRIWQNRFSHDVAQMRHKQTVQTLHDQRPPDQGLRCFLTGNFYSK